MSALSDAIKELSQGRSPVKYFLHAPVLGFDRREVSSPGYRPGGLMLRPARNAQVEGVFIPEGQVITIWSEDRPDARAIYIYAAPGASAVPTVVKKP